MLISPVQPLQIAGVVFTVALLALAWASRGRLNSMGLEFLHWNRTSTWQNVAALGFGAMCGLAVALLFQALYKGAPLKWQDAWIGITLGPLTEGCASSSQLAERRVAPKTMRVTDGKPRRPRP